VQYQVSRHQTIWYEFSEMCNLTSKYHTDYEYYSCQDEPENIVEQPDLFGRHYIKAKPAEFAGSRLKPKLRAFMGKVLKRRPACKKGEPLHNIDVSDTQRLLKHEVDKMSRSMDGNHDIGSFCELNDLLAWLDEVKVNVSLLGLEKRGEITRKIAEVELRAEWRKYALEHRPEHATEADRADIIMKVEQLDRLLMEWRANCRLSSLFPPACR